MRARISAARSATRRGGISSRQALVSAKPLVAEAAGQALEEGALRVAVGAVPLRVGGPHHHEHRGAEGAGEMAWGRSRRPASAAPGGAAPRASAGRRAGTARAAPPPAASTSAASSSSPRAAATQVGRPGRRLEQPRRLPPPGRGIALVGPAGAGVEEGERLRMRRQKLPRRRRLLPEELLRAEVRGLGRQAEGVEEREHAVHRVDRRGAPPAG